MNAIVRLAAFACAALLAIPALAQEAYPTRPIRLVVPFSPGAGTDTIARFVAQKLSDSMKAQVVVDNRTGAGGAIGAAEAAAAAPDGYTLLFVASPFTTVAAAAKNPGYDPVKQFVPVAPIAAGPLAFVVNKDVPANSMREFVALAKAMPGKLNYGSAGPTTFGGMATEWLMRLSGADYTGVTYGGRGILQGLVAGDIHLVFGGLAAATPTLQTGKAKIIAVTSAQRMTKLPDVPAVAETFPGYEVVIYYGFVAPAGTPPDIVNRLNAAIGESIQALTPKLLDMGNEPMRMAPADFKGYLARDLATWTKVVDLVK